jgi:DNA-binding NarL/FixJ family response regulator
MATIKILVVEDHRILLESLCLLLGVIDNVEVVGKASNGRAALQILENETVDLVMTDIGMPIMNGIEFIIKARTTFPNLKIMVLTVSEEGNTIKEAIRAGAMGYVFKSAEKEELEKAIKTIYAGKKYYNDEALMKLADMQASELAGEIPKVELTPREIEVLKLIVQEMSGTTIAEKLFISHTTVETHRKNLFAKIGVNSTVGLVKYALKFGIT